MSTRPGYETVGAGGTHRGAATPSVPSTLDVPDYCAHGVTYGAKCRKCGTRPAKVSQAPSLDTLPGMGLHTVSNEDIATGHKLAYRRTDPETSQAAAMIEPRALAALHDVILELLADRPSTDDELLDQYLELHDYDPDTYPRRSRQRIGTARNELVKFGKVRYSGERRVYKHHLPAQVWEARGERDG